MRIHPVLTLWLAAMTLGACDMATSPIIAGLNSTPSVSGRTALVISPNRLQMAIGGAAQLSTNAPDSLLSELQWRSSQPALVGVTQSGFVTGLAPGSAIITVRYATDTTNQASATIDVTRPAQPPQ